MFLADILKDCRRRQQQWRMHLISAIMRGKHSNSHVRWCSFTTSVMNYIHRCHWFDSLRFFSGLNSLALKFLTMTIFHCFHCVVPSSQSSTLLYLINNNSNNKAKNGSLRTKQNNPTRTKARKRACSSRQESSALVGRGKKLEKVLERFRST